MNFLKKIFNKKEGQIKTNADFWIWFQKNEKEFFTIVKQHTNIEKGFLDKLSPKLEELKEGYFFLCGMFDNQTAELILTADGNTKNIAFVEDLVSEAPIISGWKFTALKPATDITNVSISMSGHKFNSENISFYTNDFPDYPDEIDITIVHKDFNEENKSQVTRGTYIFLDNYLGELDFLTNIDYISVVGTENIQKDLITIDKLKDYLIWRQKEFIEKYTGVRHDTANDNYSGLEAKLESGNILLAVINTDLLEWDNKASHPWISKIIIGYDGRKNNGMPNDKDYKLLNEIEEEIMEELKDFDGYLNIGRQTSSNEREIYFACKDFRKPSKVLYTIQQKYLDKFAIDYDIYKDKYWQSLERFNNN